MAKCPIRDREVFAEMYPDTVLLDGFDNAIIGITYNEEVIYSFEEMCNILMTRDGMSREEAEEYIDFNVEGTIRYIPAMAPIIMYEIQV